ncbi:MAG: MgtC/SapB family protein [Spirochaetia bacterium]|nr:MgtC/SapB family protein [Spirochaetia bacterium]
MLDLGSLRELNFLSLCVRLFLGIIFSGFLGFSRNIKQRPAGIRTYMLVSIGAVLTMTLAQFEYSMINTLWNDAYKINGIGLDLSRYGAQVINGIGFLGAGSIILSGTQKIKGMTTAAGLWASGCMGLALGSGFYEGAIIGFLIILVCLFGLPIIEDSILLKSKNMNVYIEFRSIKSLKHVIELIKSLNISIFELDVMNNFDDPKTLIGANFYMELSNKNIKHSEVIMALSEFDEICNVEEI